MERGQLLSLKNRISTGQLNSVIQEILSKDDEIPVDLITSIYDALVSGQLVDSLTLGRLIIRTRDRRLFQIPSLRETLLSNYQALCDLMIAGIPDKSIEQNLCEQLASDFNNNHYGRRQLILETLRDYGSTSSLDTLESIEYEFFGHRKLAETLLIGHSKIKPKLSKEYLDQTVKETDVYIGNLIKETIKAVKLRNDIGDDLWGYEAKQVDPFSRAVNYRELAQKLLDENYLGSSLNSIRKSTEALLKSVIELKKIVPKNGEPINKLQLPALMAILMDKNNVKTPEKNIYKYLEQLRDSSTIGSHDQGEGTDNLYTHNMVKGNIETFDLVLSYFRGYV